MTLPSSPPSSIDEYELVCELGRGGMGVVHLARDTLLGREVAIKFLRDAVSPTAQARFVREARAMARIDHPNVVRVYRAGSANNTPFVVTELLDGQPLSEMERPLGLLKAWRYGLDIARGLGAAHQAGLLHRDVKLSNIILTADGRLKLIDFGLAKVRDGISTDGAPAALPDAVSNDDAGGTATLAPVDGGKAGQSPPASPANPRFGTVTLAPACGGRSESDDHPAEPTSVAAGTPNLSLPGRVAGTPRYMAPELWSSEPATAAADVFAAGVVLFELLAGQPPYPDADARDFEFGRRRRARKLAEVADVPPAWSDLVATCLHPDPSRRFADGAALHRALIALAPASGDDAQCPYPGLAPFSSDQHDQFFGRAREIAVIEDRLRMHGAAFVVGDSGVGKSSVCSAGVLPRLARAGWGPLLAIRPGTAPAERLRAAARERGLELETGSEPGAAAAALAALSRTGTWKRPVLFVDQCEELVTIADQGQARWLAEVAATFIGEGGAVLACLRSDCLGQVAALPELSSLIGDSVVAIGPLSRESLREAIVAPAATRGVTFADPGLVDELVAWAEASPGGLPLLQFALYQMWQQLDDDRRIIGRDTLDAVGGVAGALSRYADSVIDGIPQLDLNRARELLLCLVDADGRRQIRTAGDLEARDDRVLDHLVSSRLVVRQGTGAGASFTIAHEVLATRWPRLAGWRADNDDRLRTRDLRRRAAEQWLAQDRDPALLWQGARLLRARELGAAAGIEAEFVGAAVRRLWRRRLGRTAAVLAALVAALGLWKLATWQSDAETRRLIEQDLDLARRAHSAGASALTAARSEHDRALEHFRLGDSKAGESSWDQWRASATTAGRALADSARAVEAAIAKAPPERTTLELATRVAIERVELARLRDQTNLEAELIARLETLPDARRAIAQLNPPATLTISWQDPRIARVQIKRFDRSREPWPLEPVRETRESGPQDLDHGSYALIGLDNRGNELVRVPVWLSRGARVNATLGIPSGVPPGMVAIPAGPYWVGVDAPDAVRRTIAVRPPLHQRTGEPFLVGRTEVTFSQWITFVESLEPTERTPFLPRADGLVQGMSSALEDRADRWSLRFRAGKRATLHVLSSGDLLEYATRLRDQTHPWPQLPVTGVSASQARRFFAFLHTSGRVPNARFCTEDEWQRAARGADSRSYPTGDELDSNLENVDISYGRRPNRYGPNAVGLHPKNASPYGAMDMAGNAAEIVRRKDKFSAAGGTWYGPTTFATVTTWRVFGEDQRSPLVGLRVCAEYAGPISTIEVLDQGIGP